jgi:rhodanese-related sulfurtransferase
MSVITISAQDAFKTLNNEKASLLVDVRSFEEANFVGLVHPSEVDDRAVILPWKLFPSMKINPKFSEALEDFISKIFVQNPKETKVFFLCRSGARSDQAAEEFSSLGYQCFNIEHGFEGDLNDDNQRGTVNGWKASNLPWRQS